jgi:phospholipid/cholesterol/gamma-HCH transport system substrate-binding protein
LSSKRGEDRRATATPASSFPNVRGDRGASTPARIAAVAAVLVAIAVVVVLLLGGDGGHRYTFLFQTGGQLVPGNEVLTAGQRVGSVDSIDLTDDNQAAVKVTMDEPLREGTTALIRQTSLSGVANRYISLTPGPNNSPELKDDSTISGEDTTTPVDVDQLFDIFRPRVRAALQKFIRGNAGVYAGKGVLANRAYKFLNPSLSTSAKLFEELSSDSVALSRFLVSGSQTFGALADRRQDLTSLIATANQTLAAIASRNDDLDRSLAALPETLRETNTTYVNLRATLDDLDPLVEASKPVVRDLRPLLADLRPFARDSAPAFRDLANAIRKPGKGNDLVELLRSQVPLDKAANDEVQANGARRRAAFPELAQSMRDSTPQLSFFRPYAVDLTGWFDDFSTSGQTDALGNFSRAGLALTSFTFLADGTAVPVPPELRDDVLAAGAKLGRSNRCPGSIERDTGDHSVNWKPSATFNCDQSQSPVGP